MPRSPESLERRREYVRRWRLAHPDYHRQWRAEHRLEERERIKHWRILHPEKLRAQHRRYEKRHLRRKPEDLPRAFLGHPYFEEAEKICGPRPYFPADLWQWEEAMSCAVLALCEGADPAEAARCARVTERAWLMKHAEIYPNVDIDDRGRLVVIRPHDD